MLMFQWRKPMKNSLVRSCLYSAFITLLAITGCSNSPNPPVADIIPKELTANGQKRIDNYYWLNDKGNPKVIEYLKAENQYSSEIMKHTEGLQKKIYDEIVGRIKQTDESLPYKENGYYYYTKYQRGKEYPIYCRKKETLEAPEEIMFDVNQMAKGHKYYSVSGVTVSPDNKTIAFGIDTVSRRKYDIYFKDLTTGKIIDDQIFNTTGNAVWANDNKTVYYIQKDNTLRPFRIMRHTVGTSSVIDKLIFVETDVTYNLSVSKTKSKKYIIISSNSTLSDEHRILDADKPDGPIRVFQTRDKDIKYSIDHFENKFYITTNWKALNFRLMETPLDKTVKENWKEIIPNRSNVLLEGIEIFKTFWL